MEKQKVKEIIFSELKNLGFNFSHVGTMYIVEAIEMIYYSDNINITRSIEKNIYYELSKKYKKNSKTVKSNIVKATNYADEQKFIIRKGNKDYYCRVYDKMTPKTIINSILMKLSI